MSDTNTPDPAATTSTEPPQTGEPQSVDQLPQWAQDKLRELRDESARHRVAARDAGEQAKQAVTDEFNVKINDLNTQHEQTKTDLATAQLDSLKLKAVLAAGVPGEHAETIADRVRGEDEATIKADAGRLKDMLGSPRTPATDPSQGLTSGGASNPEEEFGNFILGQLK